jgi:autotransporter passenger strand-loop-strand repeat protein/autotransporter-associated beta strand protein
MTVANGAVTAARVLSGGTLRVGGGATATLTTVSSGGVFQVLSGGEASQTNLRAGAKLTANGSVLETGNRSFNGTIAGFGDIIKTGGGDLVLDAANSAFTGQAIISGGTICLSHAGALGTGSVLFASAGTSETLLIEASDAPAAGGTFANTISGFSGANEALDLRSIAFVAGATATVSSETLTLSDGGHSYGFNLAGAIGANFTVTSDGHGGTLINPTAAMFVQATAGFAAPKGGTLSPVSSGGTSGYVALVNATGSASARG